MIARVSILLYGLFSYAVFFGTFLYAIGFVTGALVPVTLDGEPRTSFGAALAIDLGLLALFAVQHSVMARRGFKRWLTKLVPQPAERSTYVLASSLALIALFYFWQPIGGVVWDVSDPMLRLALYALGACGWLLVLIATFLINHFDLFGLRQVWLYAAGKPYSPLPFGTPVLYRVVRHPLYLGWLFAFWATPTMTVAHLVFALATTAYILLAIQLEERDLMHAHPEYREYRARVPMIIPLLKRRDRRTKPAERLASS